MKAIGVGNRINYITLPSEIEENINSAGATLSGGVHSIRGGSSRESLYFILAYVTQLNLKHNV